MEGRGHSGKLCFLQVSMETSFLLGLANASDAGSLEEKTRGESGAFLLSCPPMSQWDFLQQWCFLHRSSSLGTDLRWFQLPLGGPTSFLFTKVVKDPAVANLLVALQVVGQLVFQKCPRHSACQDSQNMLTCPGSRVPVAQMSVW